MRAYRRKEILHLILMLIPIADNFELSSWPSVTGNVGQDVILPCHVNFKSQEKLIEIKWDKVIDHTFENMYQFILPMGEEIYRQDYKARADISKAGLVTGNVSLKLKNIQMSDEGNYSCFVKSSDQADQIQIRLHTENFGDNPSISSCKNWILYFLCPSFFLLVLISGVLFYCKKKEKQRKAEVRDLRNDPKLLEENLSNSEEAQVGNLENNLRLLESPSKEEFEFLEIRFYRVDLALDPKTAHPRLEVSKDGKSVRYTGNIHPVSMSKERFEFHPFVLAEQGFSEGRHYWEVEVGQKNMWDIGVASESAPRTGKITLSPQNGYWVIGCDRKDYWARTDPWTRLDMPNKPTRVGIHLNLKSHEISFYNPERKHKLYTFLHVASGKFYPFFSTGSVTGDEFDNGKLIIPPWFEKEEIVEENEINN